MRHCRTINRAKTLYLGEHRSWRQSSDLFVAKVSRTGSTGKVSKHADNNQTITADKKTMASEKTQNLQDTFLNYVRKNKTPLTIFLVNGVKLQGIVSWFDNFCVLLRRDGHSQLVYKHAISTIMPGGPVNLNDQDGEGSSG